MYYLKNKVINPHQRFKPDLAIPKYAIFCHHPTMFLALQNLEIKGFVHNLKIREHKLTTFQYEGLEIALIHAYFGAMASLHRLFEYYIRGIEYFIDIAASGSLNSNVKIGDIVLINSAIREDGLSNQFASKNEQAKPTFAVLDKLAKACISSNTEYFTGATWTTQSIYGYTNNKLNRMRKLKIQCVESETASLFIGAEWLTKRYKDTTKRKAQVATISYISDILPNKKTKHISELDKPEKLIAYKEKCLEIAIKAHYMLHLEECMVSADEELRAKALNIQVLNKSLPS